VIGIGVGYAVRSVRGEQMLNGAGLLTTVKLLIVALGSFAVPVQGGTVAALTELEEKFVPKGWSIESKIRGDLDGNGLEDSVLALIERPRSGTDPGSRHRKLVVLAAIDDGSISQIGLNKTLLRCYECFGAMGGGPELSIKNGVLIVDQLVGSRFTTQGVWRFRFDAKSRRMRLIGLDLRRTDRGEGTGTFDSTNYLTAKRIVETFRYDQQQNKYIVTDSRAMPISASSARIYLEQADSKNLDE
jgi:hypothetical protein